MGKTAVTGYEARGDTYSMDPEKLKIITDKADPFYEDRANLPMDSAEMRWLIESMMETAHDPQSRNCGNISEVLIRKDGRHSDGTDNLVVVDGRQRVRAAREINREYRELGKEPILVKCTYRKIVSLCDEVRGAVDAGQISVAAAAKLKDMGIQEQRVAIRELMESGERITARKVAEKAAVAPCADGGIPPPKAKLPKMKTRREIEKRLAEISECPEAGEEEALERNGFVYALRWVLGELDMKD